MAADHKADRCLTWRAAFLFAKRLVSLVAILLLLSLVAGCAKLTIGRKPAEVDQPDSVPPQPVELVIWASDDLAGYPVRLPLLQWVQEQTTAFHEQHPSVTIRVEPFESPAQMEEALRALPGGEGPTPDLAFSRYLPGLAPQLADLRALVPAESLDAFWPAALQGLGSESGLHGLPMLLEIHLLALNRQAFQAAGVPMPQHGRWSLAEFEASLQRLSGPGRHGVGFAILPGFADWYGLAGGLFDPSGLPVADAVQGLERLLRYRTEGWLHPETGKVSPEQIWQLFRQEPAQIAVLPVSTWALPLLTEEHPGLALDLALFPGDFTLGQHYALLLFRHESPARQKRAAELLLFLSQPHQQVHLARETGLMPARRNAANPFAGDPLLTVAYQLAGASRPLPAGPGWEQAAGPVARELRLAVVGGRSPRESVAAIMRHLTTAATPASR